MRAKRCFFNAFSGLFSQFVSVALGVIIPRLVLVQLPAGADPRTTWGWLGEHRPDLLPRVAYVGGDDEPFWSDAGVRRYATVPDAATLLADWATERG